MPITITAQPGTSPFSPGWFSNVFIACPFLACCPQRKKGRHHPGEVIPKCGGRLSRGSSRHNRGTSLAPNHDTSTNVAVWPDLSPKPAQTPGRKENRPLGGFLSGECLIRTTALLPAYLQGSGLAKSLSTPFFYAIHGFE